MFFGITRPGGGVEGKRPRQRLDLFLRQLDVGRRAVLHEIGAALGAGDGHDVRALREQPSGSWDDAMERLRNDLLASFGAGIRWAP